VHVRRCQGDVPQAWGAVAPEVPRVPRHLVASAVRLRREADAPHDLPRERHDHAGSDLDRHAGRVPGPDLGGEVPDAGVVEATVGEERVPVSDRVARDAARPAGEELEAAELLRVQRALLAPVAPSVERRVARQEGPLPAGQRRGQALGRRPAREGALEAPRIVGQSADPGENRLHVGVRELPGVDERVEDLRFQRRPAAVVKCVEEIRRVEDRRRVAPQAPSSDPDRPRELVIREALLRDVAHRAGHRAVHRETPVEEELAAQRDQLGCVLDPLRERRGRQPQGRGFDPCEGLTVGVETHGRGRGRVTATAQGGIGDQGKEKEGCGARPPPRRPDSHAGSPSIRQPSRPSRPSRLPRLPRPSRTSRAEACARPPGAGADRAARSCRCCGSRAPSR